MHTKENVYTFTYIKKKTQAYAHKKPLYMYIDIRTHSNIYIHPHTHTHTYKHVRTYLDERASQKRTVLHFDFIKQRVVEEGRVPADLWHNPKVSEKCHFCYLLSGEYHTHTHRILSILIVKSFFISRHEVMSI